MASRTDHATQRVHEQRRLIEERFLEVDAEVTRDLRALRATAAHRTEQMAQQLPGRDALERQAQDHPLAVIAGGLVSGVALGMLTDQSTDSSAGRSRSRRQFDESRNDGRGLFSLLSGPLTAALAAPMRDYVGDLMRAAAGTSGPAPSEHAAQQDGGRTEGAEQARA